MIAAWPRSVLTRRQWCRGLAAAVGALGASGCAALVSSRDERELGRQEAEEVEQAFGLVRDPALVGYVQEIGHRLAAGSPRRDITWSFAIADDPEPNAFALPGGWVYVSRGLLALANREDELAGVLGHEIGHVEARHAVRRVTAAAPFALLFGVPAALLGVVSPALGDVVGGTGRLASQVVLAAYSREQEHEADRLGVALAARSGWDPGALAGMLRSLEREDALQGRAAGRIAFLSTHPTTPERASNIAALAAGLRPAPVPPIAPGRAALLVRLDGMLVGDNPAHGLFVGSRFLAPEPDLALEMPASWATRVSPASAGAVSPAGDAVILVQPAGAGDDPVAAARADGLREPMVARLQRTTIAGLRVARLRADTRDGDRLDVTWVAHRGRVLRVAGLTAIRRWDRYRAAFEQTAASLRPLRPAERERLVEVRLRLQPARAGDTVADVVARAGGAWDPARAAVANGVAADTRLEPGWPVKLALAGRGP
jgi:predicted Zn-dependent protease